MTRQILAKSIFKVSHLTGRFELRSGIISKEYFDKYQFESDPKLLSEIAKHMAMLLPEDFDFLAGLETGGIPLATAISLQTEKPVVFVRKKAKEHGTKKIAEGPSVKGKKLVVIEDVVTSGGQVVISTNDLKKRGAKIILAICVIDRESSAKATLTENNIELKSLFTISEIKKYATE